MTVRPVSGVSAKDQAHIFDDNLQRHSATRIEDIQMQMDRQFINEATEKRHREMQRIKGLTHYRGLVGIRASNPSTLFICFHS